MGEGAQLDHLKEPKQFVNSLPPNAHSELFRCVTWVERMLQFSTDLFSCLLRNSTKRSMNDPDRICINTSTMLDGLQVLVKYPPLQRQIASQPTFLSFRWSTSLHGTLATPTKSLPLTRIWWSPRPATASEGPRISASTTRSRTRCLARPAPSTPLSFWTMATSSMSGCRLSALPCHRVLTVSCIWLYLACYFFLRWYWTAATPFEKEHKHVAFPNFSSSGIETPKLWPENTEFVNGYPKKKLPQSWRWVFRLLFAVTLKVVLRTEMSTMFISLRSIWLFTHGRLSVLNFSLLEISHNVHVSGTSAKPRWICRSDRAPMRTSTRTWATPPNRWGGALFVLWISVCCCWLICTAANRWNVSGRSSF